MSERARRTDPYETRDLSGTGLPAKLGGLIRDAARSTLPVLIEGETGTGKTYLARLIHDLGPRAGKPFVPQNCAALPEGVFESELFGHTRGAFTGAVQARRGLIEGAHSGTLFLDEIAELRPHQQAALLDVLDHGRFRHVGSDDLVRADIRIISATNQTIAVRIRDGKFRQDLYHRCAVLYLHLPPLRERRHEIPSLVTRLLKSIVGEQTGEGHPETFRFPEVSLATLSLLCSHSLPGNLRNLEHVLSVGVLRCNGGRIEPEHLRDVLDRLEQVAVLVGDQPICNAAGSDIRTRPSHLGHTPRKRRKLRYVRPEDLAEEKRQIREALALAHGNKTEAARLLDMTRQTLHLRMLHLQIDNNDLQMEPHR